MKSFKYISIALLLFSCGQGNKKVAVIDTTKTALIEAIKQAGAADSNLFTKPVTIEIWPSTRLVNKYKKEAKNEDDFYVGADDNAYYMAQSRSYLDSIKAKYVARNSEGALKFKTNTGKTYTMKLDTIYFGFILFNGKDKPVLADIVDLQGDYEKYMKK